jgi:prophage regulatory protein
MKHDREQEMELRLLSFHELKRMVGLSRSTVFKLESTGRFPRRRRVTDRKVAWVYEEVARWIEARAMVEGPGLQPKCLSKEPVAAREEPVPPSDASPTCQKPVRRGQSWWDRDDD